MVRNLSTRELINNKRSAFADLLLFIKHSKLVNEDIQPWNTQQDTIS